MTINSQNYIEMNDKAEHNPRFAASSQIQITKLHNTLIRANQAKILAKTN